MSTYVNISSVIWPLNRVLIINCQYWCCDIRKVVDPGGDNRARGCNWISAADGHRHTAEIRLRRPQLRRSDLHPGGADRDAGADATSWIMSNNQNFWTFLVIIQMRNIKPYVLSFFKHCVLHNLNVLQICKCIARVVTILQNKKGCPTFNTGEMELILISWKSST